ncbi:MAG: EVE domain-containing protein [Cyclobacteriaceae bacterium]
MNHWLLKTEPETYSWDALIKEKEGVWDGVRNHQARQNLEKMKKGDLAYIYHTGNEKAIVGTATVSKGPFPEVGAEDWTSVKLKPLKKLNSPVSLSQIKSDKRLAQISLVKMSRLSVQPLTKEEFDLILELSEPS